MTNFIFKSQGTYKKLCQQLVMIQSELRHQRSDIVNVLYKLDKILNHCKIESQALDYYDQKTLEETTTDSDEQ